MFACKCGGGVKQMLKSKLKWLSGWPNHRAYSFKNIGRYCVYKDKERRGEEAHEETVVEEGRKECGCVRKRK